jgi:nucleoside-diphosphate-sugar epimerase
VAARVITANEHYDSIYELATDEHYTQLELADMISIATGKSVSFKAIPRDQWEQAMVKSGMALYARSTLLGMFKYYEEHGFYGNGRVLEQLLGHQANRMAAFIEEYFTK